MSEDYLFLPNKFDEMGKKGKERVSPRDGLKLAISKFQDWTTVLQCR